MFGSKCKPSIKFTTLALSSIFFIAACGGSDDDSLVEIKENATFTLALSDAPVDNLSEVVVCFNAVQLKSSGEDQNASVGDDDEMLPPNDMCLDGTGNVIANTVGINLLSYQGSESIALVDGLEIDAGEYSQLRLQISEGSFGTLVDTGEKVSISVPSNELKLDGFTAAVGGTVDLTLEFDLKKAMTNPVGQEGYFLKPRGVRLVDNLLVGHIEGTVAEALLTNNECSPLTNVATSPATVYLYAGTDVAEEDMADVDGSETMQPLTSVAVSYNETDVSYDFEVGFIPEGSYTIALTCDTDDNPESDEDISFISFQNVDVAAGSTPVEVTISEQ
ncbi:DUF4382 domain-containing protein [Psychrosphaera haliotis]|uniref:DUF4382 domain-containing protein n=1 Tax=Psychrosphaera haliotis TaxID=555083 RepID=UPI002373AD4F|nr:DUF4382 domain-containing protein [Psychrosphaera haliotis]